MGLHPVKRFLHLRHPSYINTIIFIQTHSHHQPIIEEEAMIIDWIIYILDYKYLSFFTS